LTFKRPINRQFLLLRGRETDTPVIITEESIIFLSLRAGVGA
jgi:hypothetical protein